MYEYVLRRDGRDDERLISDRDSVPVGGEVEIHGRVWVVEAIEESDDPAVTERKILRPRSEEEL